MVKRYVVRILDILGSFLMAFSSFGSSQPQESVRVFEVGDWIEYRYTGSYRPKPVTLREEVVQKRGERLTILVEWRSGDDARSWKMIVVDTPENRRADRVEHLIELTPTGERERPSTREELYKLFDSTYILPNAPLERISVEVRRLNVSGVQHLCHVTMSRTVVRGQRVIWRETECDEIPWKRVGTEVTAEEEEDTVLFRMETVALGRKRAN